MMLRDFEEKQAANNEKENEEKDIKVYYHLFKHCKVLNTQCFIIV